MKCYYDAVNYVVLVYPDMSRTDYNWIQNIRRLHDRQFSMVEPHFTVVFPTEKITEQELLWHIESVRIELQSFDFKLTRARMQENIHTKNYQVHLVADEPVPEIVILHDLLYTGVIAGELRKDISYVPHITIASSEDETAMESLANEINTKGLKITGTISDYTVCSFDGTNVADIEQIQLK